MISKNPSSTATSRTSGSDPSIMNKIRHWSFLSGCVCLPRSSKTLLECKMVHSKDHFSVSFSAVFPEHSTQPAHGQCLRNNH